MAMHIGIGKRSLLCFRSHDWLGCDILSTGLTMRIPIFTVIDVAQLVALLPPFVWDSLDEFFRPTWDRQGRATVSWNSGSTAIERALLLTREFGVLMSVRFREHEKADDAWLRLQLQPPSASPSKHSKDSSSVKEYVGWAALVQLMRLSPILRPVALVLGLTSYFGAVEATKRVSTAPWPQASKKVETESKPSQAWSVASVLVQVAVVIMFSWVLAWNARLDLGCSNVDRLPSKTCDFLSTFAALDPVLLPIRLEQEWKMFCDPTKGVMGRYHMIGILRDGTEFDAWRGSKIRPDSKESIPARNEYGWRRHNEGSWRSLKFYENLHTVNGVHWREDLCRWTCRFYNNKPSSGYALAYPDRPQDLLNFTLQFEKLTEEQGVHGRENITLVGWRCF
jgi:hypothetical protein